MMATNQHALAGVETKCHIQTVSVPCSEACASAPSVSAPAALGAVAEVRAFLDTLALGNDYTNLFVEHGFDRMAAVRRLDNEDLVAMQVKPGHAKLILEAASKLNKPSAPAAGCPCSAPAPTSTIKLPPSNPPIDVAGFILKELPHLMYNGDDSFLAPPTEKTKAVWSKCLELLKEEQAKKGVLDVDSHTPSGITSHKPGYIDKENEVVFGLQTDAPLRRSIKPYGGVRIVKDALESYGYKLDPKVEEIFSKFRKTHNQGVFDVYTPEMRAARSAGILTGLPDAYGRGRIIGDYRRVALYGVDALVAAKKKEHDSLREMTEEVIRLSEELTEQIRALNELKALGASYGVDLSAPARNAHEAVQWLYLAYLASVKEQDGAAMSMGRVDVFLDYYIQKDLEAGVLTEAGAQELIDQLIIKLRLVRHLRPPAYNALFAGDPTWVTCVLTGMAPNGSHMVTRTAFRILHTLRNLGPAPEPNMTILWDPRLPEPFKRFCANVSELTSSIQYENDELMQPRFGSDYGIACCVSAMTIGKDMQFFGARCNLPKLLLYTLNEGRDELSGEQVAPKGLFSRLSTTTAVTGGEDARPLEYAEVKEKLDKAMDWLTGLYANTMNVIHFMHDKYNYERLQMALHDSHVRRFLAFGVAGLSVLTDSLSAIRHGKVFAIRNEKGIATDFRLSSHDFPKYGNDNDTVDNDAVWVVGQFSKKLHAHPTYRQSLPTLSVLTITSNVVYGQHTGNTPDGRKKGEPFAPGANPMHGRDQCGCLASLNSVAKLPYDCCLDGISNTFCIVPNALGKDETAKLSNLVSILDGYFTKGGHHLNVNVLNRDVLLDAMAHPEKYPQLTIRVSGYAVNFNKLTPDQQREVISRTFHDSFSAAVPTGVLDANASPVVMDVCPCACNH